MRIDIITIFPELFEAFGRTSLIGRATQDGLLRLNVHDLREFSDDPHRSVDDEPYGGGAGMVMAAPPWLRAVEAVAEDGWRILLSPRGRRLNDAKVQELTSRRHLVLLCGRYEGVDERVRDAVVDEEVSIGDYVVAGGELPAMVLVEAVSRYIPGVVGDPESVEHDSFRRSRLDYPQYTRPRVVAGRGVPEVLLSGNHAEIDRWRRKQALRETALRRPDLLAEAEAAPEEESLLKELEAEGVIASAKNAKVKNQPVGDDFEER